MVSVDYINADVAFTNTGCSNCRNAFVSVNGAAAVQVQFPLSGQVSVFFFFLFLFFFLPLSVGYRAFFFRDVHE